MKLWAAAFQTKYFSRSVSVSEVIRRFYQRLICKLRCHVRNLYVSPVVRVPQSSHVGTRCCTQRKRGRLGYTRTSMTHSLSSDTPTQYCYRGTYTDIVFRLCVQVLILRQKTKALPRRPTPTCPQHHQHVRDTVQCCCGREEKRGRCQHVSTQVKGESF